MKLNNKNVKETIDNAKDLLKQEQNISPALRTVMKLLLTFIEVTLQRLGLNSRNSSKPPSSDLNSKKNSKHNAKKKAGGQPGRIGKYLKQISNPDNIEVIEIDKRTLPKSKYIVDGYEARQVIDFEISIYVTEFRAQILIDEYGKRYVAKFPLYVTRPIQYGPATKSSAVYMSQYQLIPYARICDYFSAQVGLNISAGSLVNFNKEAYTALEKFDDISKTKLIQSRCINADETGVNINGKRWWLHTACNDKWTHFYAHAKRGSEAMDAIGILAKFHGVLCHDHWKPYYLYKCEHSLCNAHHLRELEWAATEDNQCWASRMQNFLVKLNQKVIDYGGKLNFRQQSYYRQRYRSVIQQAQIECPPPNNVHTKKTHGRPKKTKSRNLLERFINYENDVLRFMEDADVPFTNNQGENDLRMTKVQQKISGCFRSEDGALIFCRIRAYLITCRKHSVNPTKALEALFKGKLPDFVC